MKVEFHWNHGYHNTGVVLGHNPIGGTFLQIMFWWFSFTISYGAAEYPGEEDEHS